MVERTQSSTPLPVPITNPKLANYIFLRVIVGYIPADLVAKGQGILQRLAERFEAEVPKDEAHVFRLTHAATEAFNDLDEECVIETIFREAICDDVDAIARAYGWELDAEELTAPRDW